VYTNILNAGIYNGSYTNQQILTSPKLTNSRTHPSNHTFLYLSNLTIMDVTTMSLKVFSVANYKGRAITAIGGYLEQTSDLSLYPSRVSDAQMQLGSNQSYLITFSAPPPVSKGGFWNVTLYNSNGFLVENPLNKYTVGDRSGVTYADGTPLYSDSPSAINGSFQILIQAGNSTPPLNWTNKYVGNMNLFSMA
jgi:hypothetical protein